MRCVGCFQTKYVNVASFYSIGPIPSYLHRDYGSPGDYMDQNHLDQFFHWTLGLSEDVDTPMPLNLPDDTTDITRSVSTVASLARAAPPCIGRLPTSHEPSS